MSKAIEEYAVDTSQFTEKKKLNKLEKELQLEATDEGKASETTET